MRADWFKVQTTKTRLAGATTEWRCKLEPDYSPASHTTIREKVSISP